MILIICEIFLIKKKKKNKNTLDVEVDTRKSVSSSLPPPKFSQNDLVVLKESIQTPEFEITAGSPCIVNSMYYNTKNEETI